MRSQRTGLGSGAPPPLAVSLTFYPPSFFRAHARRLFKETKLYQQEEEGLRRKLDKHVAENAEKWDIDNTVRALLYFGFPSTCPTVHAFCSVRSVVIRSCNSLFQSVYRRRCAAACSFSFFSSCRSSVTLCLYCFNLLCCG